MRDLDHPFAWILEALFRNLLRVVLTLTLCLVFFIPWKVSRARTSMVPGTCRLRL